LRFQIAVSSLQLVSAAVAQGGSIIAPIPNREALRVGSLIRASEVWRGIDCSKMLAQYTSNTFNSYVTPDLSFSFSGPNYVGGSTPELHNTRITAKAGGLTLPFDRSNS
jgi:hypothetical protein